MDKIELTYDEVVANAKKAYEEGRLGFQNGMSNCFYSYSLADKSENDKRIGCAIGVSFLDDPERMAIIRGDDDYVSTYNSFSLADLICSEVVSFPTDLEEADACALQEVHDTLCDTYCSNTCRNEKHFRSLIGVS
jgi:hypothetical protein|tara:strand:- start:696 stop:1100 length:405 start_codon:yes stop_codon:yes gene_type:complete